ncbi:glycine betaine ABC transporter substrate-binding protein [Caulobacter sp. B11]|uniref:glycine betaine ABC transporter substrate-binding protein n=1 Tax=Caulobacter sp. B11 TaxID=2048899 RepID=UPI001F332183|nr:glycine betaine ABC transporter substrate-binding protein [Caulobacter sp. B11]
MKRDKARALGIVSLDDLARRAPDLVMGGDLEFFSRPEWASVVRAYGLDFKAKRQFQPTFMYRALGSGEADVISAFSSDGRIAADDLVVLSDPRAALPPYDAVLLIAPGRAGDRRLRAALSGWRARSRSRPCAPPITASIVTPRRRPRPRRRGPWPTAWRASRGRSLRERARFLVSGQISGGGDDRAFRWVFTVASRRETGNLPPCVS